MKKITLPKETTDKWAQMTDENAHREVRIEIAKFFDMKDFERLFTKIYESVEDKGYWVGFALDCYIQTTHAMLYRISNLYGKRIAKRVNNCL